MTVSNRSQSYPRACKFCAYSGSAFSGKFEASVSRDSVMYSFCYRNAKEYIDPVSGVSIWENITPCKKERTDPIWPLSFFIERCGSAGKYFQPKKSIRSEYEKYLEEKNANSI